ncbi:MAG: hypothetical protein AAB896_01695 [Patescibacteria group bacterium]
MGYSFGAMDAAVLSKVLKDDTELLALGIFEPTNVMVRTPKDLQKAFTKSGLSAFKKAVKDAQIPALQEALRWDRLAADFIKFGLSTLFVKENKAIKSGMAANNLSDDLMPVLDEHPGVPTLLASAEHSLITPPEQLYYHYGRLGNLMSRPNLDMHVVEGYGHEMGDNIVLHGLLGKAVLSRHKK